MKRSRRGSNALVAVGSDVVLKLFRQIESGPNPEIEARTHLRAVGFTAVPALRAGFRWMPPADPRGGAAWIGILQEFVPNDGEAWDVAVAAARAFLRAALRTHRIPPPSRSLVPSVWGDAPPDAGIDGLIGGYVDHVRRLGDRAAQLHQALGTPISQAFAPEPFSAFSRRSEYQRMRRTAVSALEMLRTRLPVLDEDTRALADPVLAVRDRLLDVFRYWLERPITAPRIRCHGNFHLGQVLMAGDELVILDFDGEPGRPLYERRLKRSPIVDVATMIRSFHYAAHGALARVRDDGRRDVAMQWLRAWQGRVADLFIHAYARGMTDVPLLPSYADDAHALLHSYLVERALYEIEFELTRGSAWIRAPLRDLPVLLDGASGNGAAPPPV